jgi:hypothetical protein
MKYLLLALVLTGCGGARDYWEARRDNFTNHFWTHGGCTIKDGKNCEREPGADEQYLPTAVNPPEPQPSHTPEVIVGPQGQQGIPGESIQGEKGDPGESCTIELRDPKNKPCGISYKQILVCPDNTEAEVGKVCQ